MGHVSSENTYKTTFGGKNKQQQQHFIIIKYNSIYCYKKHNKHDAGMPSSVSRGEYELH